MAPHAKSPTFNLYNNSKYSTCKFGSSFSEVKFQLIIITITSLLQRRVAAGVSEAASYSLCYPVHFTVDLSTGCLKFMVDLREPIFTNFI